MLGLPDGAGYEVDAVTETSEFADHLGGASVRSLFGDGGATFLVCDALVQYLPHEAAEPMGNRADGLRVSQAHDQSTIHQLEDAALSLHRGIGGLIEKPAHLPIAMWRATAVIDARAFIVTRTRPHPRREPLGRGKGRGGRPDLGDDLLRRIDTETRHGRQSLYGVLMRAEQPRNFLVELLNVRFD